MNPGIGQENKHLYEFGAFRLDPVERVLARDGERIPLTPKAFETLLVLVQHSGRVLTKDQLIKTVWPDSFVEENNLTQHISTLRRALGQDTTEQEYIETVPKQGYRFIPEVREIANGEGELVVSKRTRTRIVLREEVESEESEPSRRASQQNQALTVVASAEPVAEPRNGVRWVLTLLAVALVAVSVLAVLRGPSHPPKALHYVQITNDGKPKTRPVSFINILLTDGSRIYFALGTRKGWELAQVSASGGEAVTIPLPIDGIIPCDISRGHSQLLLGGGGKGTALPGSPFWVLPLPGGPVARLGDVLARGASWSADGRRLAYAQQQALYIANADGSEARRIVTYDPSAFQPFQPRWSPDGKVLRFYLFDVKRGSGGLWEIAADGSNPHALFPNWSSGSETCCGLWTADGKYFVFQATHDNVTDIWVRRERAAFLGSGSTEPVQMTFGPMNFLAPTPSVDGKQLFAIGEQGRGELMRYDSASRQFVSYFSGASVEGLDFSADGQSAVYTAFPEGTLWRSRTDGSERLQLSPPGWRAYGPRWSPDGKKVAFMGTKSNGPAKSDGTWKIYLIPSEGGRPEAVSQGDEIQWHPNWSLKGDALIYGDPWWSAAPTIHMVDMTTRRASTLPNSEGFYSPSWSPDGRYVAAVSKDLRKVVLFEFATQHWTELALMDAVGHLAWSRRGEYVYFDAATKDSVSIYRVDARSHRMERVAAIPPHVAPPFELFSPWTGLDPDDSPLLMRDTSVQEIYALDVQWP